MFALTNTVCRLQCGACSKFFSHLFVFWLSFKFQVMGAKIKREHKSDQRIFKSSLCQTVVMLWTLWSKRQNAFS